MSTLYYTVSRVFLFFSFSIAIAFLVLSCSDTEIESTCGATAVSIDQFSSCLIFENETLSETQKNTIEQKVVLGMKMINGLIPIENLTIRISDDTMPKYVGFTEQWFRL